MKLHSLRCITAAFSFITTLSFSSAQVFPGGAVFVEYPGLSTSCIAALNSTVACVDSLVEVTWSDLMPSDTQLRSLCVQSCGSSLESLRTAVAGACTAENDTITIDGEIWPATYIPERFQYYYGLKCLQDATTNRYCTSIFNSYANLTTFPDECTDCLLGTQKYSLSSPFGYSESWAEDFSSTTVSCSKTAEYVYTPPTATGTPVTPSVPPTTTSCANAYTVQSGDTCVSIALAQNVSSFAITYENSLLSSCEDLPAAGSSLCLPDLCQTYTVLEGDSCYSIAKDWGTYITVTQLVSWNYQLNTLCGNIDQWVGSVICVSPPGDDLEASPTNTVVNPTEVTTAAPAPTNLGPDTNTQCAKYYEVLVGDTCADVSVRNGISLDDFYFLNPGIDADCYNLLSGFNYCVQAVGSISTYISYNGITTTGNICFQTNAPDSCWVEPTDLPVVPYESSGPTTTSYASPAPTGTRNDCDTYREYIVVNATDPTDAASVSEAEQFETKLNSCATVADFYGVAVADLVEWNPTLTNSDNCTLLEGFRYCVQLGDPVEATTSNPWIIPTATATPVGTIDTCFNYASVQGVEKTDYPCQDLLDDYHITQAELTAWNPWVLSDCSGLYTDLDDYDYRDVCVSASGTATGTPTTPPTISPTSNIPGPTQTGIVADCTAYTLAESGDSCSSIQTEYTITFAQLYEWNPAIGSNCENLWAGYAYCVAISGGSTTTPTITTTPTAAPTQTGMVEGCTQIYTVVSGDSCSSIQTQFSISFATFYSWNPSVGSNCEGLWLGYGYCVAAPGGPPSSTSSAAPVPTPPAQTQAGIAENCNAYYVAVSGDSCWSIQQMYVLTFDQLYQWNPALGSGCGGLWADYAYCVGVAS